MTEDKSFGERVRERRRALGLTGRDVLAVSGISRTMLSEVEGGTRNLRAVHWPDLARALRVPVRLLARWAGACEACSGTGERPSKTRANVVGSSAGAKRRR